MAADRSAYQALGLMIRGVIRGYQLLLAPLLPPACRFYPSCSTLRRRGDRVHGPWHGLLLAVRRLSRHHHPWGGSGYDPVPGTLASNLRN